MYSDVSELHASPTLDSLKLLTAYSQQKQGSCRGFGSFLSVLILAAKQVNFSMSSARLFWQRSASTNSLAEPFIETHFYFL